jgi:post-segregation antitoxin (ccd killing protein)
MPERYVRVTVSLPASLYERVKASTDNVSGFVAKALEARLQSLDLLQALEATTGLMAETFADLKTPEDIVAHLHRERAGWRDRQ